MEILELILIFYLLEEAYGIILKDKKTMLKSHEMFMRDFFPFREKFIHSFAHMIYDYMLYTISNEVVESLDRCDITFNKGFGHSFVYVSRKIIEDEMANINPDDLLSKSKDLFLEGCWEYGFGGEAWAKACLMTNQYGKISDLEFIDNIIDLQHNNGSILSKDSSNWESHYPSYKINTLLNLKTKPQSWFEINSKFFPEILTKDFRKMILKFIHLYHPWDKKVENDFIKKFWYKSHSWEFLNQTFNEVLNYKGIDYQYKFKLGKLIDNENSF